MYSPLLAYFSFPFFWKSLLNLFQYCFLFYVLVFWPWGMWDLSSPTTDQTHTPCIGRRSLNHWFTREVPSIFFLLWESKWNFIVVVNVLGHCLPPIMLRTSAIMTLNIIFSKVYRQRESLYITMKTTQKCFRFLNWLKIQTIKW